MVSGTKYLLGLFLFLTALTGMASGAKLLIPMDLSQSDHLKAYGVTYWALSRGLEIEWLLNYRGGSFMLDVDGRVEAEARVRGVLYQTISDAEVARVYATIEEENMEKVVLEKAPRIAVYTPPNSQPWDDAVTLALRYAEIDYTPVWDEEMLDGTISDYDWLHLHHEDFTGQYGRFYISYQRQPWYQQQKAEYERRATALGFKKVSHMKGAVARAIKSYVAQGGFLFAMCSATDTFDIALAAEGLDIVPAVCDGDGTTPNASSRLDFSKTTMFESFNLERNQMAYEFSDIDTSPTRMDQIRGAEADYFTLFDFSAKFSPVESMLTQCHTNVIRGFLGQTTGYRRDRLKSSVVILADAPGTMETKYLHANLGKGTFTFYGGHDPEDYTHRVGDPPTNLALHKNSPGYRLILNNVLFPAARKKTLKT